MHKAEWNRIKKNNNLSTVRLYSTIWFSVRPPLKLIHCAVHSVIVKVVKYSNVLFGYIAEIEIGI